MDKDFKNWHNLKKQIDDRPIRPYFHEREIWWCSMGVNVGFEQDGKGQHFSRPIMILKRFNNQVFLGVPLTTKPKVGKYYIEIYLEDFITRKAIISQIRLFDAKRLRKKFAVIDLKQFLQIKKAAMRLLA